MACSPPSASPGGRSERLIPDPVARAGTEPRRTVARVRQPAAIKRQAAAPDALRESRPEPLQLGDPVLDPGAPRARQPRPIAARGRVTARETIKLDADLLERQPDPLGEHDE